MRLLSLGCFAAAVAAALVMDGEVGSTTPAGPVAPSVAVSAAGAHPVGAEVAPPPQAAQSGAPSPEAPGERSAADVMAQLLSARSSLGPTEAEFSWVIGPLGVNQQRFEGRLSVVDATRYRVVFARVGAGGAGQSSLLVPDGRWAYQFSGGDTMGIRVDLAYLKQQVRDPAPRVGYDPAGGVLLEVLQQRGYVTYEGDEIVEAGRCAVLSYAGRSFRSDSTAGAGTQTKAVARTRLRYRYEDGLLVGEEEVDSQGGSQSTYRVRTPHRFEPTPDLLRVPESPHCVDLTKQLVRRLLYGPPQPVPGARAR